MSYTSRPDQTYHLDHAAHAATSLYKTSDYGSEEEAVKRVDELLYALRRRELVGGVQDVNLVRKVLQGYSQGALAEMFGKSQPSICYDYERARYRMRLMAEAIELMGDDPSISELYDRLDYPELRERARVYLSHLWMIPHQSALGRYLGVPQSTVYYSAFRRIVDPTIPEVIAIHHLVNGWSRWRLYKDRLKANT